MNRKINEANQRSNRKKSIISCAFQTNDIKANKNKSIVVVSEDIEKAVNDETKAGMFIFK